MIDKYSVAYYYHTERKATQNKRDKVQDTDDPIEWMLKSKVHYLHQLSQVQEDTVDLNYEPHNSVPNEPAFSNTIHQATQHLHTQTYTNYNNYSLSKIITDIANNSQQTDPSSRYRYRMFTDTSHYTSPAILTKNLHIDLDKSMAKSLGSGVKTKIKI